MKHFTTRQETPMFEIDGKSYPVRWDARYATWTCYGNGQLWMRDLNGSWFHAHDH